MPKESLSINAFEGGLNTSADPRDIGGEDNNQVSEATGVDLRLSGRIINQVSGQVDTGIDLGNQVNGTQGYGLFSFSADYDSGGSLQDTDYYYHMVDGNSTCKESDGTDANDLEVSLGDTHTKPAFFAADGGIRISDGNFSNVDGHNRVQNVKYVINDCIGALGTGATGGWIKGNTTLEPPGGVTVNDSKTDAATPSPQEVEVYFEAHTTASDTATGWGKEGTSATSGAAQAENSTIQWEIGASFVYDEDQESTVTIADTFTGGTAANYVATTDSCMRFATGRKFRVGVAIKTGSSTDLANTEQTNRITMVKIYMRKKESGTAWYLIAEANLKTGGGVRNPFDDEYNDWSTSGMTGGSFGVTNYKDSPPQAITFRSETGYDADEGLSYEARFKTACVVNRRAYIGNIAQKQAGAGSFTNASIHGDRLLKTGANQFDLYPEGNWIDVVINDGDYITCMVTYADRIFQFKRRNLYVLNVSEDSEFLEGQYLNYGVASPSQVVVCSYGVLWVNEHGIFRYDGEAIIDLTADKLDPNDLAITELTIGDASTISIPGITYVEKLRTLFVCPDLAQTAANFDGTGGWAYNFSRESLVKLPIGFFATGIKTNFNIDPKGQAVYMCGSNLYKIGTTAAAQTEYAVQTKDIDFGEIGIQKKIYKVKVTYRCNSTSNVKVSYASDGNTSTYTELHANLPSTSNQWSSISTSVNLNVNSLRIKFEHVGTVPADFQINDISIIYRMLTAK
jgi:hypothetical protein